VTSDHVCSGTGWGLWSPPKRRPWVSSDGMWRVLHRRGLPTKAVAWACWSATLPARNPPTGSLHTCWIEADRLGFGATGLLIPRAGVGTKSPPPSGGVTAASDQGTGDAWVFAIPPYPGIPRRRQDQHPISEECFGVELFCQPPPPPKLAREREGCGSTINGIPG